MRVSRSISVVLAVGLLAGCATTPPEPLHTPVSTMAASSSDAATAERPLPREWWTTFQDAELNRLVAIAREHNRDLEVAAARIDEARARARLAGAESALHVTGVVGAGRSRSSESLKTPFPVDPGPRSDFNLGADMSYEVDLWGKVRATREAAQKQVEVSEAERAALEISLLVRLASLHFARLAALREAAILERQLTGYSDAEQVLDIRTGAGLDSELDLQRVRVEQATREGELAQVKLRAQLAWQSIALLCGQPPEMTQVKLSADSVAIVPKVPSQLSMVLLESRPDVAAARALWESARARMEAARAAFYPSLNLYGTIGYESSQVEDLLDWQSRLWSIVAGLTAPILDGGRLRGTLDIERAQVHAAAANYEQVILTAYREVADALQALHYLSNQHQAAVAGCEAAGNALAISKDRYESGFVSFLEVVDSDRSLLSAERSLIQVDAQRQAATVDLIRALGIP